MTQTSKVDRMDEAAQKSGCGEMNNFQAALFARADFAPFRGSDQVWTEFLFWWRCRWPSRPLPAQHGPHNLRVLTGLSDEYLKRRLLEKRFPLSEEISPLI